MYVYPTPSSPYHDAGDPRDLLRVLGLGLGGGRVLEGDPGEGGAAGLATDGHGGHANALVLKKKKNCVKAELFCPFVKGCGCNITLQKSLFCGEQKRLSTQLHRNAITIMQKGKNSTHWPNSRLTNVFLAYIDFKVTR